MSEPNMASAPADELSEPDRTLEVRHTWECRKMEDGGTVTLVVGANVMGVSRWCFDLTGVMKGEYWEASVMLTASEAKNLALFILASGRMPPEPGHDG